MSVKNLGIILFSGFLIFALDPVMPAQGKDTGKGVSKEEAREIQTALKDAGFDPGPIDGVIGARTKRAIRDFQFDTGILATGKIDDETLSTLEVGNYSTTVASVEHRQPLSEAEFERVERESELGQTEENAAVVESPEISREKPAGEEPVIPAGEEPVIEEQERTHPQTHSKTEMKAETTAQSETKDSNKNDKESKSVAERVDKAADVLMALTGAEDKRIPNNLLERAEAIAVIPKMVKGAFGIGGRYGKGVVSKRLSNGRWSPPAFIEVGGGSFGLQLGVSSTDLVLVFTDAKGLDLLSGGRELKLGADASVAAGPIGRSAEAGVTGKLDSGVWAYSRAKGLFAGISLDGAVLDIDNSANRKMYGESAMTEQILNGSTAAKPGVRSFMDALERTVPKKKMSQR